MVREVLKITLAPLFTFFGIETNKPAVLQPCLAVIYNA